MFVDENALLSILHLTNSAYRHRCAIVKMPISSSSAASVSLSRLVARKEGLCVGIGIAICFARSKKKSQYCCEMVAHSTMCSWVSSATLHDA